MRKILIVVDMQNDFIHGSLGTAEAESIVQPVIDKIKEYEPENIWATRDTHEEDYLDTQEGRRLPVKHCIRGTKGWEIADAVAEVMPKATVIDKPTFGSVQLADQLAALSAKEEIELEMVGLCTDICVVSNALCLKARMPEVPIAVDAACCAGVTPQSHRAALETMGMCQIVIQNGCLPGDHVSSS